MHYPEGYWFYAQFYKNGLTGIVKINRNSLYGYDCFEAESIFTDEVLEGLTWNVVHGAKVVNVSLGIGGSAQPGVTDPSYDKMMNFLLNLGYDFVVVQGAGNSTEDATLNGVFALATEAHLRRRIITVGATDRNGDMAVFSNYGALVDVLAPGVEIYSTMATSDLAYANQSGTSVAAPHVTGVASLVWAANPGLSGDQVKKVVVTSANNFGRQVTDTRTTVPEAEQRVYRQINANAAVGTAIRVTNPTFTTGQLAGQVITANADGTDGDAIGNARITLYSSTGDIAINQTSSDAEGYYRIDDIAIGNYYLEIVVQGYTTERFFVQIEAGVTTHIHRLRAIPTSTLDGTIGGLIIDAYTGRIISGTEISLDFRRGIDYDPNAPGEIVKSIKTSTGMYATTLPAGNYTVTAHGDGYITTTSYVYSYGGSTFDSQNVVVSPQFSGGDSKIRVVLTWGQLPSDLDSHLVGPKRDGSNFHVAYFSKSYHDYSDTISSLYANLDVDDVTSYGPETVTINTLVDGTYNYYIQDYSNLESTTSRHLKISQATIRIYGENNELLRTFNVPTSGGASTIWHVFKVVVQGGQYSIVPVNTMHNVPTSPRNVGNSISRSIAGSSLDLTAEQIEAKANAQAKADADEKANAEAKAKIEAEENAKANANAKKVIE